LIQKVDSNSQQQTQQISTTRTYRINLSLGLMRYDWLQKLKMIES